MRCISQVASSDRRYQEVACWNLLAGIGTGGSEQQSLSVFGEHARSRAVNPADAFKSGASSEIPPPSHEAGFMFWRHVAKRQP